MSLSVYLSAVRALRSGLSAARLHAVICTVLDDTTMLSPEEAENMIPVSKRYAFVPIGELLRVNGEDVCCRLEQLKTYGENEWKKRVKSPNDADEFTVEGKLRQAGTC